MKTCAFVRIAAVVFATSFIAGAQTNQIPPADLPHMLDFSEFYRKRFVTPTAKDKDLAPLVGQQMYDGLPFLIEGRATLYGRKQVRSPAGAKNYPDLVDISVSRAFDELHLLHASQWADVEGETIAFVRLNYADGTSYESPIRYGAHVRDWLRLRSEEKELLTDPNTKVVFRGQPGTSSYKSTIRMFKTMLANPHPKKFVATLDVVSMRHLAAYDLVAATVAKRDSTRPVTPSLPLNEPERNFDGAVTVRVLDDTTRQPIQGALLDPGMHVDDTYVIASPLYTSTNGTAVIRYPLGRTRSIYVSAEKSSYATQRSDWRDGNIPDAFTFRLKPEESGAGSSPQGQ